MPATEWGWMISPEELQGWILSQNEEVLVVDKPPHVICHPSRHGPWSSLVGACREYLGVERLRMPYRLDRETSGVIVLALDRASGSRLHRAVYAHRFRKTYLAILCGSLKAAITVREPIGRDEKSEFFARRAVVAEGGEAAETVFVPVAEGGGFTLARVHPKTGRRHQIRVHAAWLGLPLVGDKLYGSDAGVMMQFIREGFSQKLLARLPLRRHALHCARVEFLTARGTETFEAPPPADLEVFAAERMGVAAEAWEEACR